jgi:hypothetical protein
MPQTQTVRSIISNANPQNISSTMLVSLWVLASISTVFVILKINNQVFRQSFLIN